MQFRDLRVYPSRLISDHGIVAPDLAFRQTTHHVAELFMQLLPRKYVLDGSSLVQINCGPRGDEPQCVQVLGSTSYFVEEFDFQSYARASPPDRERTVLATIETALCDIAQRAGADAAVLMSTAAAVFDCGFRSSVEVAKLRKQLPQSGGKIRVFRCLGADIGETWMFRLLRRDGTLLSETVMDKSPGHLDRRDHFKTANLENGYYVVRDRLGDVTFVFDTSALER